MIPGLANSSSLVQETWLSRWDSPAFLALVVLGIVSSLLVPDLILGLLIVFLALALRGTGWGPVDLIQACRPWAFMVLLILGIHVFTTTEAAPLGHPSWGGLLAGLRALTRVLASIGWLVLFTRLKSLDDLVGALRWWLRPLELMGFPADQGALALAVAIGTVPGVVAEGRRIDAVLRMRRASGSGVSWQRRLVDRVVVVVPLLENLMRRAEAISLSLRTRQPTNTRLAKRPRFWQLAVLALWLGTLVFGMSAGEFI